MRRTISTPKAALFASTLAVAAALTGTGAWADHKTHDHRAFPQRGHHPDRPAHDHAHLVRVHIPIREHGPETLPLGRLIKRQRHMDLSSYRLRAVVISNGPHSNGFATLRTGDRRSGRYFLPGHQRVLIPAPSRAARDWRLRLGPGTQVRAVTAVLEPRWRAAYRDDDYYPHDPRHRRGYERDHTRAPAIDHEPRRHRDKSIKHQRERFVDAFERQNRAENADRTRRAERQTPQGREARQRIYPRLRAHTG